MSMYRQMWLAIIVSTLLAFAGGLLASTFNARSYLSEQLSSKNNDNAAALALALGQQNPTQAMIELNVAALFDTGHYELIRVVDAQGAVVAERKAANTIRNVPAWFIGALPLSVTPGQAQISSGWNQLGTLTIVSSSNYAYQSLWKIALQLALALTVSGLLGGFLGALTLRRLREPLKRVIDQANAISDRRFMLIDAPDVPELKQLALAMNSAVTRLKGMFAEESQRLELLRITANYDPLTGLANRTFFLVQLLDMIDTGKAAGGSLLLVRVANFSANRERLGQPAANELLKLFAETLRQFATQTKGVAARLGEAEFALLLPREVDTRATALNLLQTLVDSGSLLVDKVPLAHIGTARLLHGQDIAGLLAQASQALSAAESQGGNAIREATASQDASTTSVAHETAQQVSTALEQRKTRLASRPVFDLKGNVVHQQCPLELKLDGTDNWQEVNQFTQVAEMFQLTPLMDVTALRLGLEKLENEPSLPGVSIGLSAHSLREENFRQRLLTLIKSHPRAAPRLWLEVPEADVLKHSLALPAFIADAHKAGCRVGLTQFGRHFSHSDSLHDFGLDFLKVDSSFIRGIQYSADNQVFLKSLSAAAHKMGMQVYAEGVIDRAELAALGEAGFDGASGTVVKDA